MRIATRMLAIGLTAVHLGRPSVASAQADPQERVQRQAQTTMGAGDINRPTAAPVSGIQLNASSNSTQATLNLAGQFANGWGLSVTTSSPLSMGTTSSGGNSATNANIASLDGLANGFALKAKIGRFRMAGYDTGSAAQNAIRDAAFARCSQKMREAKGVTADSAGRLCDSMKFSEVIRTYAGTTKSESEHLFKEYHDAHFAHATAWTYGAQAGLGYNDFTYYHPSTFAKLTSHDVPYSAQAFLGVMPRMTLNMIVSVSVEYQQAYQAVPSSTKCQTIQGSVQCVTGSVGAPSDANKFLLAGDIHAYLPSIAGHQIAIAPRYTYDALGNASGIDVPIYLVADDKGNLISGIEFGWTSRKHDFSVGVFVGAPFSFF
jgi:hypothetical protein